MLRMLRPLSKGTKITLTNPSKILKNAQQQCHCLSAKCCYGKMCNPPSFHDQSLENRKQYPDSIISHQDAKVQITIKTNRQYTSRTNSKEGH